ncbi:MAG: hypothetical protein WAM14_15515 [Candidatus Nitrosopolaris sp.]
MRYQIRQQPLREEIRLIEANTLNGIEQKDLLLQLIDTYRQSDKQKDALTVM